jgi:AcrR family transcriptional regulator
MGRPPKYEAEQILDAALLLVAEQGPAAATVAAIAGRLGAPTGSIYHRFGSRDLILANLWIRGIRRFQRGFIDALHADDAEAAALHVVAWCREHPVEASVLLLHRREDLATQWPEDLGDQLDSLNGEAETAYRMFAGRHPDTDGNRPAFALFDLPLGAVRRHISDRLPPPPWVDELVLTAVRAILGS